MKNTYEKHIHTTEEHIHYRRTHDENGPRLPAHVYQHKPSGERSLRKL